MPGALEAWIKYLKEKGVFENILNRSDITTESSEDDDSSSSNSEYDDSSSSNSEYASKHTACEDAVKKTPSNEFSEEEKQKRDRKMGTAIIVLQSYVRTYLVRKRLKVQRRQDFDANRKEIYSIDELGEQMSRLSYFFHRFEDEHRFTELSKQVLANRQEIITKLPTDFLWLLRVRNMLKYSLTFRGPHVRPAVYIRLFEELTAVTNISEDHVKCLSIIWVHLVVEGWFFAFWRDHMENKCFGLASPQPSPLYPLAMAFMDILTRPLNIAHLLLSSQGYINDGKTKLTGRGAAYLIFEKFTESFALDVIHPPNYHVPRNGVGTYLVLPFLADRFAAYTEYLNYIASTRITDQIRGRNILYTILTLSVPLNSFQWRSPTELFQAIGQLLFSIDPENNPRIITHEDRDDDDDMTEEVLETDEYKKYIGHMQCILKILVQLFNAAPIVNWLESNFDQNWELLKPVISILARFERRKNLQDFVFLSVLAYRRNLMKNLYLKVLSARMTTGMEGGHRDLDDLFTFCFFFTHLMSTLHDAEFLDAIPMTLNQLTELVIHLKDVYSDIIINGKDGKPDDYHTAVAEMVANTLMVLYDRTTRMVLFPEGTFLSNSLRAICPVQMHALGFADFSQNRYSRELAQLSPVDAKFLKILNQFPFCLSFHERVSAWHRLLDMDKSHRFTPYGMREQIQIRRTHIYEDAYEKLSAENVHDMRDNIRISLVNVVGAEEAGVDGGGLLREFLSEATRAGVDPNRGLFRLDSQNRIYPNPVAKKIDPNYKDHFFLMGRLVGKALYEQTLLELPLAAFFIQTCISGNIDSAVDYLSTLDASLHRNLLTLKTYTGDWNALGLDFTLTLEELGDMRTIELKKDGAQISVDKSNVIEYIHLVADYKINKEMESEIRYFRKGLFDVVPILKLFSWREMQTLISGSDKAIDIEDWMKFTHYGGGYSNTHPTIELFWRILRTFDETHLRKLLKFVTSCSRPPILGFKDLVPNFGIQSAGVSDRLPTAATCMNLLKLPELTDFELLREKLIYAIDAQAGFELS